MLDVPVDAAESVLVLDLAALVRVHDLELLLARAVQNHLLLLFGQLLERRLEVEPVGLGDRPKLREHPHVARLPQRDQSAVVNRLARLGDDQVQVDFAPDAQSAARRARAVRTVERKRVGRRLGVAQAAFGVDQVAREEHVAALVRQVGDDRPLAHSERRVDRLGHARPDAVFDDEPVDDDFDVVRLVPVELHAVLDLAQLAVDADALVALLGYLLEQFAVVALTSL